MDRSGCSSWPCTRVRVSWTSAELAMAMSGGVRLGGLDGVGRGGKGGYPRPWTEYGFFRIPADGSTFFGKGSTSRVEEVAVTGAERTLGC